MKVKELIDYINSNDFYSLWDMENALCCDFLDKELPQRIAENLEKDEHRWYEVSVSVYKLEDGFVGIKGVSKIYDECTTPEDCCTKCSASEYIEIPSVTYKKNSYEKKN